MKKHQPLTKLERELLNKLDESSGAMKQADQQLQENHKEIARLKAKLTDPQLPQGFKCSPATQHALSTSKALLATAQRLLQEEINHHISTQLQGIADRTTKALKKMEYQKALAGPYSVAVLAINRKREEVSQTGIIIDTHVNGPVKALIDWNSKELFTFETLLQSEFSVNGQEYSITKSDISQINAGNTYYFESIRHSTR